MKEEKKIYKVVVTPGLLLAKMIEAGKYDWFNHDINDKHFSLQGAGQYEVELVLIHQKWVMFPTYDATSRHVLNFMNEQGLEPAKIEHLLAFGSTYPDVQREFKIAALGSSLLDDVGDRNYPYLYCYDDKRRLDLNWPDYSSVWEYTSYWYFLAVRKTG